MVHYVVYSANCGYWIGWKKCRNSLQLKDLRTTGDKGFEPLLTDPESVKSVLPRHTCSPFQIDETLENKLFSIIRDTTIYFEIIATGSTGVAPGCYWRFSEYVGKTLRRADSKQTDEISTSSDDARFSVLPALLATH